MDTDPDRDTGKTCLGGGMLLVHLSVCQLLNMNLSLTFFLRVAMHHVRT